MQIARSGGGEGAGQKSRRGFEGRGLSPAGSLELIAARSQTVPLPAGLLPHV